MKLNEKVPVSTSSYSFPGWCPEPIEHGIQKLRSGNSHNCVASGLPAGYKRSLTAVNEPRPMSIETSTGEVRLVFVTDTTSPTPSRFRINLSACSKLVWLARRSKNPLKYSAVASLAT